MKTSERAFTLAEVLVGAAVAFFILWCLVVAVNRYAASAASLNQRLTAMNAMGRLTERLSSESASAWAVFVPPNDVLGQNNGDGHELDFFAEDGSHRPYAWAYRYDALAKTLTRYAYAPGVAPQAGEIIGNFDAFVAQAADVTALANPSDPAYDALFSHATASSVRYTFAAMPPAVGGNGIVRVSVAADGVTQTDILASGTAPTSFTIVETYTPAPLATTPTPGPLPTLTPTP